MCLAKDSSVTSTTWAGSDKSSWAFSEFKCELNGERSTKQGNRERKRTREHIKREGHHNGLCVTSQTARVHRVLHLHSYTGKRLWSLCILQPFASEIYVITWSNTHTHQDSIALRLYISVQAHYRMFFFSKDTKCVYSKSSALFLWFLALASFHIKAALH